MTIRRFCALLTVAGIALVLAACGGSGGKSTATKTVNKTAVATRAVTPNATGAANATTPPTASSNGGGTTPGGSSNVTPSLNPTAIPRVTGQAALYRVTLTVASDPGNLKPLVENRSRFPTRITVTRGDGGRIQFDANSPFFRSTGTIDANGQFTATGTGRIDPYSNIEATFTGTIGADGNLNGTYTIGTNGAMPGHATIAYTIAGTPSSPLRTPASQ
jgi:hypothetical protein